MYDFMKMHDYVSDTAYSFKFSASICIPVCIEIAKIAQTNSNYLKLTIIESTVLWSPLYYLPCPPLKFCPSQIQTESSMMKSLKKLHAFQFLCWYYYKQCYINNFSNMHSNVQVNNSVTTSTTNSCYMCWGPVNCGHLKNSKEPSHFTIIMVKVSYISTLVFELTEQVCNRYVIC